MPLTARQHVTRLLTHQAYTDRELSCQVHLSERQVEDHLTHIIRSLVRNPSQQFVRGESKCLDCGYEFRNRIRVKRPSRCPHCRSEAISYPRFFISDRVLNKKKKGSALPTQ